MLSVPYLLVVLCSQYVVGRAKVDKQELHLPDTDRVVTVLCSSAVSKEVLANRENIQSWMIRNPVSEEILTLPATHEVRSILWVVT